MSLPAEVIRKRLQRGIPLDAPYRGRQKPDHSLPYIACPLTLALRSWRRSEPNLGVRQNLKARVK